VGGIAGEPDMLSSFVIIIVMRQVVIVSSNMDWMTILFVQQCPHSLCSLLFYYQCPSSSLHYSFSFDKKGTRPGFGC